MQEQVQDVEVECHRDVHGVVHGARKLHGASPVIHDVATEERCTEVVDEWPIQDLRREAHADGEDLGESHQNQGQQPCEQVLAPPTGEVRIHDPDDRGHHRHAGSCGDRVEDDAGLV